MGDRLNSFFGAAPEAALYHPAFVADKGVTSTLTVKDARMVYNSDTNRFYGLEGVGYNPEDPLYGGIYTLTTKDGTAYDIDARTGDLLTVRDTNGNTLTFTDTAITSSTGQQITFERDAQNRITSVKDPLALAMPEGLLGELIRYTYDAKGDLVAVSDQEQNESQMTSLVLSTGASITMSYDLAGNMLAMGDGKGNVIQSYTYGPRGIVWSETDVTGTTRYEYDGAGNVTKSIGPDGKATLMEYFADGKLKRMTEDNGTPDDLSDDEVSTFTYDKLGREKRADYGNGIYVEYGYEGGGGDWMTLDAPTIGHMERKLTADGKLAGWVTPDGGTPTFIYDQAGRLWQETDATGNVTTEYGYDAAGRLTSVKDVTTGAIATKQYDAGNRVTEEVNPLGVFTKYEYDIARNGGKLKSVTSGKYVKDADGNWVVDTSVALQTTTFEYNGLRTTVIDSLGRRTTSVMDEYSLPLETIFEQRDGRDYSTQTSYLYSNNLQEAKDYPTRTVDIGGNDRVFTYDDFGRLKTATDLGDGLYSYSYGDDGLELITGPTGETLGYGYDDLGNLAQVTYGDGTTKTLDYYETDNRLKSTTLASTETISYTYDAAGRIEAQTTSTGLSTGFTYDANGNVKTVTDSTTGTTTYTYEAVTNRLSKIEYGNGSSIAYTYDLVGRMKSQTEKGSLTGTAYTTEYDYDAFGNLNWVKDPSGGVTTMKYDGGNRMTERLLPNGVKTTWEYDDLDRVQSITHANAQGEVLASATYERQGIGEPTRITREDGTYVKLQYDSALRVTKESYYNAANVLLDETEYVYDAAGKRIAQVTELGRQTYDYTAGYQLDTITETGEVEDYDYDANGRLTAIQRDGQTLDLEHDVYDRLTTVENETTSTTTRYVYDSQGRRVSATDGMNQRMFLVTPAMGSGLESTDLMTDGAGNLISNYIYAGGSSPFMRLDTNGNPVYYLTDGMGSVIGLADGAGSSAARFAYDAFGNVRSSLGVGADPTGGDFRFQGQWLESASGLYNFHARDYDSRTATFLSRDPVDSTAQEPEALSPYQFAYGNPYIYSDPTGMFTLMELSAGQTLQRQLATVRTVAMNEARDYLKDRIQQVASDLLFDTISSFVPGAQLLKALKSGSPRQQGIEFEDQITGNLCDVLGSLGSLLSNVYFEPALKGNGNPTANGYNCKQLDLVDFIRNSGWITDPRPDYILSPVPPKENINGEKGWMVGDFKRRVKTITNWINDDSTTFNAMTNYAKRHQDFPAVSFVTYYSGYMQDYKDVAKEGLKHNVIILVLSISEKKR